jgi:hypothetical protein
MVDKPTSKDLKSSISITKEKNTKITSTLNQTKISSINVEKNINNIITDITKNLSNLTTNDKQQISKLKDIKEQKETNSIDIIKETTNNNKSEDIQNYLCAICINMLVLPVTTKCNHLFCKSCFIKYTENCSLDNLRCPLCKSNIKYDKIKEFPEVVMNTELDKKLKKLFEEDYKKRYSYVVKELELIDKSTKVRFIYGNTYRKVENAPVSRTNPDLKCDHGYTLFVKVFNKPSIHYISKVKYVLHPTYKVTDFEIKTEPFELSRRAWGYFDVPITITLNKNYKTVDDKKTIEINHLLSFDGEGKSDEIVIYLKKL